MYVHMRLGVLLVFVLLGGVAARAAPFAYIADDGASNVSVIDTATNTIIATITGVGSVPEGVAVNAAGPAFWVWRSTRREHAFIPGSEAARR